jgi:hypothetical protein
MDPSVHQRLLASRATIIARAIPCGAARWEARAAWPLRRELLIRWEPPIDLHDCDDAVVRLCDDHTPRAGEHVRKHLLRLPLT